jgi:hypothetical protein
LTRRAPIRISPPPVDKGRVDPLLSAKRIKWSLDGATPPGRIHRIRDRIPETPDRERGARNLFDRRSWLGSSGEESRRFRANAGLEIALVLWANPLSLLSLSGQIFRFIYGGHVASGAFIVILGVLLMGLIGWAAEWRESLRAALANKPQSP